LNGTSSPSSRTTTRLLSGVAVALIAMTLILGVRSIVADDARFGWRMFSGRVTYEIDYFWRSSDGTTVRYVPGAELRGAVETYLSGRRSGTSYDTGAMRAWVCGYVSYVYHHLRPADTASFEAHVRYRENRGGTWRAELFSAPAGRGNSCD
jgi:hypothetical protein